VVAQPPVMLGDGDTGRVGSPRKGTLPRGPDVGWLLVAPRGSELATSSVGLQNQNVEVAHG
jgi:hypothetical protein